MGHWVCDHVSESTEVSGSMTMCLGQHGSVGLWPCVWVSMGQWVCDYVSGSVWVNRSVTMCLGQRGSVGL